MVWRDTPIASASCPWARSFWIRSARTLFFITYGRLTPAGVRRRGRQWRFTPGQQAAITPGSQATETIGVQLPCLIAWTAEEAATNATAIPDMRYSHRFHDHMTGLLL